jgi:uncharacterized protein (TIGR03437 family)
MRDMRPAQLWLITVPMRGIRAALLLSLGILFVPSLWIPQARAQVSPTGGPPGVTVNFATNAITPLNPGFNGFNANMKNAVEYFDTNFQHMLTTLSPGWLRFPGGTDSEAFNWATGEIVPAWVDALSAKQYTHDINAAALPIVAGKGGAQFSDFAAMAAAAGGAKIIVSVNAYTDTPQSAQAFAKFALTNHIPVAVWELDNEPYTWLFTDAGGPGPFFTDAADYAAKMKPFRDAIKAADPNAVVSIYFSEAGNQNKAWDNALAAFSPKYWDAVTYHEYVLPGNLTSFSDLMGAANASLFSNTTGYVTDYLAPKNNPGMSYVISEVSPAAGQGGPLLGTLYGGIYSAEFLLRMSTLPQVKYVASFQMLSNAGIDETNPHLNTVQAAYDSGTTVNTTGLNFGFFVSAQGAGEVVANVALHNSTGVYSTTTVGGPAAPANGGNIPAVYAQAYQGPNGKHYVVLTNKSAIGAVARVTQDGADLAVPMQSTFVTGNDPSLTNSGLPSDPIQIQTQTIANAGAVTIPPYSVVRLEWPITASISLVANAEGESLTIAPNTWVEIKGSNLAPIGDSRTWKSSDFVNTQMPKQLDGVNVTVNGKSAYVYYVSPAQVNILTPPDAMQGPVTVAITNGALSTTFTAQAQALSPSFFVFNGGPYVAATHANGTLLGPASLFPGSTTPAKPNEIIVLYANGFGQTSIPIVSGSATQSGSLSPLPVVKIGGVNAVVQFAGLVAPGEFQFNVVVPSSIADGDQPITATYNGSVTQGGTLITIQH